MAQLTLTHFLTTMSKRYSAVFNPRLKQWIGYWTGHP